MGPIEVLAKPGSSFSVGDMSAQLKEKIRAAAKANLQPVRRTQASPSPLPRIPPRPSAKQPKR